MEIKAKRLTGVRGTEGNKFRHHPSEKNATTSSKRVVRRAGGRLATMLDTRPDNRVKVWQKRATRGGKLGRDHNIPFQGCYRQSSSLGIRKVGIHFQDGVDGRRENDLNYGLAQAIGQTMYPI